MQLLKEELLSRGSVSFDYFISSSQPRTAHAHVGYCNNQCHVNKSFSHSRTIRLGDLNPSHEIASYFTRSDKHNCFVHSMFPAPFRPSFVVFCSLKPHKLQARLDKRGTSSNDGYFSAFLMFISLFMVV